MVAFTYLLIAIMSLFSLTSIAMVPSRVQTPATTLSSLHLTSPSIDFRSQIGFNNPYITLFDGVSLAKCAPALGILSNQQGAELPQLWQMYTEAPVKVIKYQGCYIGINGLKRWTAVTLSSARIAAYAKSVLEQCQQQGQGGWTSIEENNQWVVHVNGYINAEVANRTEE